MKLTITTPESVVIEVGGNSDQCLLALESAMTVLWSGSQEAKDEPEPVRLVMQKPDVVDFASERVQHASAISAVEYYSNSYAGSSEKIEEFLRDYLEHVGLRREVFDNDTLFWQTCDNFSLEGMVPWNSRFGEELKTS